MWIIVSRYNNNANKKRWAGFKRDGKIYFMAYELLNKIYRENLEIKLQLLKKNYFFHRVQKCICPTIFLSPINVCSNSVGMWHGKWGCMTSSAQTKIRVGTKLVSNASNLGHKSVSCSSTLIYPVHRFRRRFRAILRAKSQYLFRPGGPRQKDRSRSADSLRKNCVSLLRLCMCARLQTQTSECLRLYANK